MTPLTPREEMVLAIAMNALSDKATPPETSPPNTTSSSKSSPSPQALLTPVTSPLAIIATANSELSQALSSSSPPRGLRAPSSSRESLHPQPLSLGLKNKTPPRQQTTDSNDAQKSVLSSLPKFSVTSPSPLTNTPIPSPTTFGKTQILLPIRLKVFSSTDEDGHGCGSPGLPGSFVGQFEEIERVRVSDSVEDDGDGENKGGEEGKGSVGSEGIDGSLTPRGASITPLALSSIASPISPQTQAKEPQEQAPSTPAGQKSFNALEAEIHSLLASLSSESTLTSHASSLPGNISIPIPGYPGGGIFLPSSPLTVMMANTNTTTNPSTDSTPPPLPPRPSNSPTSAQAPPSPTHSNLQNPPVLTPLGKTILERMADLSPTLPDTAIFPATPAKTPRAGTNTNTKTNNTEPQLSPAPSQSPSKSPSIQKNQAQYFEPAIPSSKRTKRKKSDKRVKVLVPGTPDGGVTSVRETESARIVREARHVSTSVSLRGGGLGGAASGSGSVSGDQGGSSGKGAGSQLPGNLVGEFVREVDSGPSSPPGGGSDRGGQGGAGGGDKKGKCKAGSGDGDGDGDDDDEGEPYVSRKGKKMVVEPNKGVHPDIQKWDEECNQKDEEKNRPCTELARKAMLAYRDSASEGWATHSRLLGVQEQREKVWKQTEDRHEAELVKLKQEALAQMALTSEQAKAIKALQHAIKLQDERDRKVKAAAAAAGGGEGEGTIDADVEEKLREQIKQLEDKARLSGSDNGVMISKKKCDEELKVLQDEIARLKATVVNTKGSRSGFQTTVDDKDERKALDDEKQAIKDEKKALKNELQKTKDKLQNVKNDLAATKGNSSSTGTPSASGCEEEKKALKKAEEDLKKAYEELQQARDDLFDNNTYMERVLRDLKTAENDAEIMRVERDAAIKECGDAEQEMRNFKQQLGADVNMSYKDAETDCDRNLKMAEECLEDNIMTLKKRDQMIADLRKKLEDEEAIKYALAQRLKESENAVSVPSAVPAMGPTQQELDSCNAENDKLKKENQELRDADKNNSKRATSDGASQQDLNDANKEIKRLERELKDMESNYDAAKNRAEIATDNETKCDSDLAAARKVIKDLKDEINQLKKNPSTSKDEGQCQADLAAANSKIEDLRDEVYRLQTTTPPTRPPLSSLPPTPVSNVKPTSKANPNDPCTSFSCKDEKRALKDALARYVAQFGSDAQVSRTVLPEDASISERIARSTSDGGSIGDPDFGKGMTVSDLVLVSARETLRLSVETDDQLANLMKLGVKTALEQLDKAKAEIVDLKKKLKDAEGMVKAAGEGKADKAKIAELEQEVSNLKDKINDLKQKLDDAKILATAVNQAPDCSAERAKIVSLEVKIDDLEDAARDHKDDYDNVKDKIKNLEKARDNARDELRKFKRTLGKSTEGEDQKKVDDLEKQLDAYDADVQRLTRERNAERQNATAADADRRKLQDEVHRVIQDLADRRKKHNELKENYTDLRIKYLASKKTGNPLQQTDKDQLDACNRLVKDYRKQVKKNEADVAKCKKQIADLKAKHVEHRKKWKVTLKKMEDELAIAENQLAKIDRMKKKSESEEQKTIIKLREKYEELQDELAAWKRGHPDQSEPEPIEPASAPNSGGPILFALTRVELALSDMVQNRAHYGKTDDDTEFALSAAMNAVALAHELKEEDWSARANFWLAVVQLYAGNDQKAEQSFEDAYDNVEKVRDLELRDAMIEWSAQSRVSTQVNTRQPGYRQHFRVHPTWLSTGARGSSSPGNSSVPTTP